MGIVDGAAVATWPDGSTTTTTGKGAADLEQPAPKKGAEAKSKGMTKAATQSIITPDLPEDSIITPDLPQDGSITPPCKQESDGEIWSTPGADWSEVQGTPSRSDQAGSPGSASVASPAAASGVTGRAGSCSGAASPSAASTATTQAGLVKHQLMTLLGKTPSSTAPPKYGGRSGSQWSIMRLESMQGESHCSLKCMCSSQGSCPFCVRACMHACVVRYGTGYGIRQKKGKQVVSISSKQLSMKLKGHLCWQLFMMLENGEPVESVVATKNSMMAKSLSL
eukprot:3605325-Amphidinium_carterae.1